MGHLGQIHPPPPPPSPFGGTIFLIKILNFMSGLITHNNDMHILVAFITNSPETKASHSQTSCEIVLQNLRAY